MKKTQFRIGLLTACLLSVNSVASAQSCGAETRDSKACKCSRQNCDDKGLLEVINNTASSVEAKLASLISDRDKPSAMKKGGCAKCSAKSEFAIQQSENSPPIPATLPMETPVAQPDVLRPPKPRWMPPPNAIQDPVPVPTTRTPELVPLPETPADPFRDESTRVLRPVPARPAGYLRSNGSSQIEFDPQASHRKAMRSILMSKAASKSISDAELATTTSTRRAQPLGENENSFTERSAIEQSAAEVVPASLSMPMSGLSGPIATQPKTEQFINPLRAR